MTFKKWILLFAAGALAGALLLCGFNYITDPFGVFGDRLFDAYSYNMTQNPRSAKIAWLDKNFEAYDSYIVGCSKTSSFAADKLGEGFDGARFYNMLMYGGDMYDIEQTCKYIIESYTVKNIVVNTGLEELFSYNAEGDPVKESLHAKVDGSSTALFYAGHLFQNPAYGADKLAALIKSGFLPSPDEVFDVETGAYDKRLRDVEAIGDLGGYLEKYPEFTWEQENHDSLPAVNDCLASIGRVLDMCRENDVSFTLVISPLYDSELDMYYCGDVPRFFRALAELTPYWDFSGYTPVSGEPRYFYDYAHFRGCVGDMMLAKMFGDESVYVPEDFGWYVTADNVEKRLSAYERDESFPESLEMRVPVLIYHHLVGRDEPCGEFTVTEDVFEAQISALAENGYTAIGIDDMISYVERGTELPEKPVLITFDDGYESNITLAAPILRKYGMRATVFVIGVSVGKDTYKDTGVPITAHFGWEQALESSDVIDIQSHTYDLHQSPELDGEDCRHGLLRMDGESEGSYIDAFREDFFRFRQQYLENMGGEVTALAYPHGEYDDYSEILLSELGVKVTFSTEERINTIVKGLPQSLRALGRIGVFQTTTGAELAERLESREG